MSRPIVPSRLVPEVSNRYWREEDAERVLAHWSQSGLTLSAFARQCGLSVCRLYRWRKRLERSDVPRFHPIEIIAAPARADADVFSEDSGVELVHASGHRITVRRDFDAAALTQLLEVLGASRC